MNVRGTHHPRGDFGLDDKRVLITGGTAGIGLAVARRFVEAGASVAIAGRRAEGAIAADGGMTLGMSYGTLRALGAPAGVMSPSSPPESRSTSTHEETP